MPLKYSLTAVFACSLLFSSTASSAPVTWYLQDVTFYDGGQAIGQFDYDESTNIFSNASISTSGDGFAPIIYLSIADSSTTSLTLDSIEPGHLDLLYLSFSEQLLESLQMVSLSGNEDGPFGSRGISSGFVATSPVPVPSAVWLFGSGLIGLIGVARRKKA